MHKFRYKYTSLSNSPALDDVPGSGTGVGDAVIRGSRIGATYDYLAIL